jgi:polysaccharide biosynthesis/export protein
MKKYQRLIVCVFFLLFLSFDYGWAAGDAPTQAAAGKTADEIKGNNNDYIIGPGDQLDISVWKDETLTKLVSVLPDGKIYFPLIGEMAAGGKTISQLKREMEESLKPYMNELILSVDVRQVNSLLIYVIGRVNSPGRLALNANVNVLQALATAGGLNPFARRTQIRIFRQEGSETKIFKFDYDDVSNGSHLEQNINLKRGDVIVVP